MGLSRPSGQAAANLSGSGTFSVVLIEDSASELVLIRESFARAGSMASVVGYPTGAEAVRALSGWAEARLPSLVLLDLNLPDMSGHKVLSELRRLPEFALVPIVIFTGSEDEEDRQTSYRLGANAHVVKPKEITAFIDAVIWIDRFWSLAAGKLPNSP